MTTIDPATPTRASKPVPKPPRRLSKKPKPQRAAMSPPAQSPQNRHSMFSSTFQDSPPSIAATPETSSSSSRPTHSRATSLLSFSFRNRTHSHSNSAPNTSLTPLRESPKEPSVNSNAEFGAQQQLQQQHAAAQQARTSTLTAQESPRPSLDQQQQAASPRTSISPGAAGSSRQRMHAEIRSLVDLTVAHAHKVYFSGPLVKHVERHTDGKQVGREEPWKEVWAQLGGTTLSVWDMEEIKRASERGEEVPPTYLNITDAFVNVLGGVTMPAQGNKPAMKHSNVITLTTAGMNLLLFSCPSPQALLSWTAAFRLASYEKSRLEELYTAAILRMSLSENGVWKEPRTPLVNGRLEGWVKVRVAGQVDWKRLWMVLQSSNIDNNPPSHEETKKNRMSALFSRPPDIPPPPSRSYIALFHSNKIKDRKKPALTMANISQAFAVYPERPELISRSTLLKIEGFLGDDEIAGEWKCREGWILLMPEAEQARLGTMEMLKWLVGLHDAFSLYGRPQGYNWNPRDPVSLMFAYPVGPNKNYLFLDRPLAEKVDPREDRTSFVRSHLRDILFQRMYPNGPSPEKSNGVGPAHKAFGDGLSRSPPLLPPIEDLSDGKSGADRESDTSSAKALSQGRPSLEQPPSLNGDGLGLPQLPPLDFDSPHSPSSPPTGPGRTTLSPITERSSTGHTNSRTSTLDKSSRSPPSAQNSLGRGGSLAGQGSINQPETIREESNTVIPNTQLRESPTPSTAPVDVVPEGQLSARPSSSSRYSEDSVTAISSVTPQAPQNTQAARLPSLPAYSHQDPIGLPPSTVHSPVSEQLSSPRISSTATSPRPDSVASSSIRLVSSGPALSTSSTARSGSGLRTASPVSNRLPSPSSSALEHQLKSQTANGAADIALAPAVPPRSPSRTPSSTPGPQITAANNASISPGSPSSEKYVFDEEVAAYYVNMAEQQDHKEQQQLSPSQPAKQMARRITSTMTTTNSAADDDSDDLHSLLTNPMSIAATEPLHNPHQSPIKGSPQRRQTPMAFDRFSVEDNDQDDSEDDEQEHQNYASPRGLLQVQSGNSHSVPRSLLARKPSGARAPPQPSLLQSRRFDSSATTASSLQRPSLNVQEALRDTSGTARRSSTVSEQDIPSPLQTSRRRGTNASTMEDTAADALAALSFLEQQEAPAETPFERKNVSSPKSPVSPGGEAASPPLILEPEERAPSPSSQSATQFRSSFALSKQAAERKARAQAQQAAHEAAVHRPGRPNGKGQQPQAKHSRQREAAGWDSSDDEEEEEEEEEEEDDDERSDEDSRRPASANRSANGHGQAPVPSVPLSASANAPLVPPATRDSIYQGQGRGLSPPASQSRVDVNQQNQQHPYQQQRPVRTLPQIPRGRSPGGSDDVHGQQRRYPDHNFQQPAPVPSRPLWSTVLDPGRHQPVTDNGGKDTFIQLEPQSETMTKAFTPQGLLSAGLKEKQDRSAKHQEEIARETGASLINVPNKPPPPQTGLLGAISAHERERNREGGMGAALTEREREKRMAEDRQRKLDEFQRQQLDQQQQMAQGMYPMYGAGLSPQMTGMGPMGNPYFPGMMGSPSMFYNPMMMNPMGGYMDPQHMFAAQQAAMAYQQAMVAMSTAGSQIGGDGGVAGGARNSGLATGNGGSPPPQAAMGMGFDPRMSMMGMPPMGMPPMGMGGMGLGMGMGMPPMNPQMGMQMTGSNFDPRMSMVPGQFGGAGGSQFDAGNRPPSGGNFGPTPPSQFQRPSSFAASSPAESPGPRPLSEVNDEPNRRVENDSPRG